MKTLPIAVIFAAAVTAAAAFKGSSFTLSSPSADKTLTGGATADYISEWLEKVGFYSKKIF